MIDVAFGELTVRHVLIDVVSNLGASDATGLSEVQFFGMAPVPEPTSALLMLAGVALLATRLRQRGRAGRRAV